MAIAIASAGAFIRATPYIAPTSAGTLAVRVKPNWNHNDSTDHVLWFFGSAATPFLAYQKYNDNNVYIGWHSGGDQRITAAADSAMFTNGTWASHVFTWSDSGDDEKLYVDSVQKGSRTSTLTTSTLSVINCTIGNYSETFDFPAHASMADFAQWSVVLTADERVAYDKGFSPQMIRPASLLVYLPLVRDVLDVKGSAFTNTGGTAAPHPRVFMSKKSGRRWGSIVGST